MSTRISPDSQRATLKDDWILNSEQPDLFFDSMDTTPLQFSREEVCLLVAKVTHGLSRDRVADDMTAMGCPTSKAMIDAWASPARSSHNLPFYLAAPLESACRTTELTDWHVSLRGGSARYGADALRRELAEEMAMLASERADFTKRINTLRKQLGRI